MRLWLTHEAVLMQAELTRAPGMPITSLRINNGKFAFAEFRCCWHTLSHRARDTTAALYHYIAVTLCHCSIVPLYHNVRVAGILKKPLWDAS